MGLWRFFATMLASLALAGCMEPTGTSGSDRTIGISTSLPILWPDAPDIADLLGDDAPPHWVLAELRRRGEVQPLDTLAVDHAGAGAAKLPLARDGLLVLAQPYPFSPQEYGALDDWVRSGGRVLLFADPMLTAHSGYALGDRRRPQAIIKLDPILMRWGLQLQFDADQAAGVRQVSVPGGRMPVNVSGAFVMSDRQGRCRLEAGGLIADCAIGDGRVLAVADAAMLESDRESGADLFADSRRQMLVRLLNRLED